MFFVVPIGHQHAQARRWPMVTTVVIAVCLVALVLSMAEDRYVRARLDDTVARAHGYASEHPYLRPSPPFRSMPEDATWPEALPPAEVVAGEQRRFDELVGEVREVIASRPSTRFGWIPAEGRWLGLITYQFMHGGWLHFAFNAWFLWLSGCNVEDRWGRLVYLPFYLAAGIAAALTHGLLTQDPSAPLIGASGAVAGAMGAFLVTHGASRVRFGYATWFLRPIWGTFEARAFVVLPFWLVTELFDGVMNPGDTAAHFAHVGGFVFGSTVALVLRLTGIDRRLDATAERAVTSSQDPRLALVSSLIDEGRFDEAFARLERLERERPEDIDVLLETSRAAIAAKDAARTARASLRLSAATLGAGMREAALGHVNELRAEGGVDHTSPDERFALAERLARQGLREPASWLYRSLFPAGPDSELGVRAAIASATLDLREGRRQEAADLLRAALASPFCTAELAEKVRAQREFARNSAPPPDAG